MGRLRAAVGRARSPGAGRRLPAGRHQRAAGPAPVPGPRPGRRTTSSPRSPPRPDGQQPGQLVSAASPFTRVRDLGQQVEQVPRVRAAPFIREDVRHPLSGKMSMSGRESLGAVDGERRNLHRPAWVPPASPRHAGHISLNHGTAGHSPTSGLCRVPGRRRRRKHD